MSRLNSKPNAIVSFGRILMKFLVWITSHWAAAETAVTLGSDRCQGAGGSSVYGGGMHSTGARLVLVPSCVFSCTRGTLPSFTSH